MDASETAQDLLVDREALTRTTIVTRPAGVLEDGQLRLAVEAFALTANNVTYAVVGKAMKYWNFFPASEGWGRVPVWGYARIVESRHAGFGIGERLYGYLPMSTGLVVTPGKIRDGLFSDMTAHRQPMAAVYNQYHRLPAEPVPVAAMEEARMLLEPLFLTSFLIEESLRGTGWHGAQRVVLTSASSKTALGLAHVMAAGSPGIRRIGLTSARNLGFVRSTGLYDQVTAYDNVASIEPGEDALVVDFAGDMALLGRIEAAAGDGQVPVLRVGATHHQDSGNMAALRIKPVWFFAPDAAATLIRQVGQEGFRDAVAVRWQAFAEAAMAWTRVCRIDGLERAVPAWTELVDGRADADRGIIVHLA